VLVPVVLGGLVGLPDLVARAVAAAHAVPAADVVEIDVLAGLDALDARDERVDVVLRSADREVQVLRRGIDGEGAVPVRAKYLRVEEVEALAVGLEMRVDLALDPDLEDLA
jgi:hypothetical protein